jgi:hypothetical protein
MSFVTGTQAELLYCMPITGASITNTVSTASTGVITPAATATSGQPYQLPAYFFPDTYGTGKAILIQGGGTLLSGPATQTVRFGLFLDTSINVQGTLLAATGAFSPFGTTVSQTGAFMFEVLLTCTAVGTAGTMNTIGRLFTGQSGNTATAATGVTMLMNSATQPVFNNATSYYIEMFANFGATTTTQAVTLTNFLVWGLN